MAVKTVTVLLKAITGAYRAEMTKSAAATQALGTAASRGGKMTQMLTGALGPTGLAAAKVAAGFGAVGGVTWALASSAKAAIDFESQFAGVKKTLDVTGLSAEATEATYSALAEGFRGIAREIPASTEEITKVGEAAGQLGIRRDNILDFTRVMVDLGNTTNLSAENAATALARLANIMGTNQNQFDNMGSTLVDLGNKFATTEQEIANMSLRLAGAGEVIGLTEADVFAFATTLTSLGVRAEAGGSAFSRVFLTIQDAVKAGGAELELFADVAGVSATKFAEAYSKDPARAIQLFTEGLGRMIESGGDVTGVLEELSLNEIRVRDALLRTAAAGDLLSRSLDVSAKAWRENRALQEEAEKRYETTASKVEIAKNNINDLGISMGNNLLPVIGDVAAALTTIIQGFQGTGEAAQNFGDVVLQSIGQAVAALPGISLIADRNRQAAENLNLMNNGLLESSIDLEVWTNRLKDTEPTQQNFSSQLGGMNYQVREQSVVLSQVNPSLKLTQEHQALAGMAAKQHGDQVEGANLMFEKEKEALDNTTEALENLTDAQQATIEGIMGWTDPLLFYMDNLEAKNEAEKKAAEVQAEGTKSQKDSWEDFFTETKASFSVYMSSLDEQLEAQRNWHKNLNTIRKAAGSDYSDYLASLGPEHADLVASIAAQEENEIRKAAKRQTKLRKEAADETLARQIRQGVIQIDKARGINQETVNVIAAELGVAPDMVKEILMDANSKAGRQWRNMRDDAKKGTKEVVKEIKEKFGDGVKDVEGIARRYAKALANGLNPVIRSVGGKPIVVATAQLGQAGLSGQNAEGDFVEGSRARAHITKQMSVLYGEPETHGEAYIPFAPSKRQRSRSIADQTVHRLGGRVEWMADGGFASTSDIPKVPDVPSGAVGDAAEATMSHARKAASEWLDKNLAPAIGGKPGSWTKMWQAVKKAVPGVQLISAFRPGAITATGNPSYHGMGRAIDISPMMSAFNWIAKNYAATELIFSPAGMRQEWHGRPHMYSGITRSMHWDHVHWAMRNGGIINALFQDKFVPKRSYRRALWELRSAARDRNKRFFEDFSYKPGMSKNAKTWNDAIADRYAKGHDDFSRGRVVKALSSYIKKAQSNMEWNRTVDKRIKKHFPEYGRSDRHTDLDLPFRKFDQGGMLPTGLSVAYNGTGAPERVLPGGMGGQVMVIVPGLNQTFMGEVRQMQAGYSRLQTQRLRAGA